MKLIYSNIFANKIILFFFTLIPFFIIFSKFFAELLIFIIVTYIIAKNFFNKKKKIILLNFLNNNNYFFLFTFFFMYIFLNALIQNPELNNNLKALALQRFSILLLLPILFIKNNNKFELKKVIIILILFPPILLSIDIYTQFFFGENLVGYRESIAGYGRYSGFFEDELIAGSYLYFAFFFCWITCLKFRINNNLSLVIIFVLYVAVYLTGDRQPFLSLNLGLIILLLLFIKKIKLIIKKNFKRIFFFLSIIFLIFFLIYDKNVISLSKRYLNTLNEAKNFDMKNSNYYYHFSKSILIFRANPIFGSGYKSFRNECSNPVYNDKYKKSLDERHFDGCTTHPHNYYLEILSELGAVGFLFFICLIFKIISASTKNIFTDSKNSNNYKILTTFLITFFFPLKPTGSFYTNFNLIMFFFTISYFFLITKIIIKKK
jgi:O-antigen ligase